MIASEHYRAQSPAFRLALEQFNAAIAAAVRESDRTALRAWRDRLLADRLAQLRTGEVSRTLAQAILGCSAADRYPTPPLVTATANAA